MNKPKSIEKKLEKFTQCQIDKVIHAYIENNLTFAQAAELAGLTVPEAKKICKIKGIKKFSKAPLDEVEVVRLFEGGMRQYDIAKIMHRDQASISRILTRHGINGELQRLTRSKETLLQKYGSDNPQHAPGVQAKTKDTLKNRYGINNVFEMNNSHVTGWWDLHGSTVLKKSFKSSMSTKQYTFPSGRTVQIQGYEGLALNILLRNYNEEDIRVCSEMEIIIDYYDDVDKKNRKHYPDIYIESINTLIEVKSTYTMKISKNVLLKKQAAEERGYGYQIWVFSGYNSVDPCEII